MKEQSSLKYIQKNMVIGNKMRSVVIIDKKPKVKSAQSNATFTKKSNAVVQTVRRKKCGGCGRNRRS